MQTLPSAPEPGPGGARQRRATMRDVAALAGVSLSTVSRVVNGSRSVDDSAAGRVREAARLLGYRPDRTASSLRRADRRSGLIGLVVDDVVNPFFSQLHRGVDEVLTGHGMVALVAGTGRDEQREEEILTTFASHSVDGLIVAPAGSTTAGLEREHRAGTPVVVVDRVPPGTGFDRVVADNTAGAAEAVEALLAAGHTRIAFLGGRQGITSTEQRLAGYRRPLLDRGGYDEDLVATELDAADLGPRLAAMLAMPSPPTAVLSAQNLLTESVLRHLHAHGLQHGVGVVGFDDLPLGELLDPPLSTVSADPAELGREAARLLLTRRSGTSSAGPAGPTGPAEPADPAGSTGPQVRVVPATLTLRGSELAGVTGPHAH